MSANARATIRSWSCWRPIRLARTQDAEPSSLVPDNGLFALGGAGLACLGVLVWMIAAGPGYLGYGASLLWTGPKKDVAPLYAIAVTPGDVAVRRNSDQLDNRACDRHAAGEGADFCSLSERGGVGASDHAGAAGLGWRWRLISLCLPGLPENVEYYVAAGPLVSPHYKVRVVDLPSVKEIRVTYHYPKWTGMKPVTEEHAGDLRAIEGTDAALEVEMDRPLKDGQLTLDGGKTIQLASGEGNKYRGTIHHEKDGAYHVAATDQGQPVRLSEDYFIATDKAKPPEVAISRPDWRLSRQSDRRGHGRGKGIGSVRAERCASALLRQRRAGSRREPAQELRARKKPMALTPCGWKISSWCRAIW